MNNYEKLGHAVVWAICCFIIGFALSATLTVALNLWFLAPPMEALITCSFIGGMMGILGFISGWNWER